MADGSAEQTPTRGCRTINQYRYHDNWLENLMISASPLGRTANRYPQKCCQTLDSP
jgi:hypothetical protein